MKFLKETKQDVIDAIHQNFRPITWIIEKIKNFFEFLPYKIGL